MNEFYLRYTGYILKNFLVDLAPFKLVHWSICVVRRITTKVHRQLNQTMEMVIATPRQTYYLSVLRNNNHPIFDELRISLKNIA